MSYSRFRYAMVRAKMREWLAEDPANHDEDCPIYQHADGWTSWGRCYCLERRWDEYTERLEESAV